MNNRLRQSDDPDRRGSSGPGGFVAEVGRPAPFGRLPRWARVADALVVLFVLLAIVVSISGGFHTHFGTLRVTFTSWFRLMAAAAVVAGVRHALVRSAPIHHELSARLSSWWREPGVRTALAAFLGTRPAILFVGCLAIFVFGYAPGAPPFRVSENELINLPVRWDAGWYLQIAIHGYQYVHNRPDLQQNIVFFPAYPMLVMIGGLLFGNRELSYVLAAVVVSLTAWIGALRYLYALARDFLADEDARYAIWLLAAYPFAIFFGAIYTESLFLLGATGAFYHFSRRQFWRSAAWGLLVGLTRPNGCFLAFPLGLLAIAPTLPPALVGGREDRSALQNGSRSRRERLVDLPAWATAAAPGVGVLLYSAYIWWLTGDPVAWAAGHVAWGREYKGLSVLVSDRYGYIWHAGLYGYVAQLPHDLLNALGVIFVLLGTWPVYRRIGIAYAVFILINILPPLAAGGLLSAGRFSSVLFPVFIWFAGWVPARHRAGWIASFAALQALDAALFYTWRPLY